MVVLADDRVLVAAGEDADGNVLDQAMLDALAAAAVSALTPTVNHDLTARGSGPAKSLNEPVRLTGRRRRRGVVGSAIAGWPEHGFDVDDWCAVDGLEVAHADPGAVDGDDLDEMQPDRVRTIG